MQTTRLRIFSKEIELLAKIDAESYLWFMRPIPPLKPGDQIHLLSTARKISNEELQPAIKELKSWGLEVKMGQNLFESYHQFAGTTEQRRADFQAALDDPECKAIICSRGGYGSVQIIDQLDFSSFKKNPKWIVGYSDVTVIHCHLQQVLNAESIHATMPISFPKDGKANEAIQSLKKALFGEELNYEFQAEKISRLKPEIIRAKVLGGNLSILYSLTGTASQINTQDAILFMEDLDEYLYHIDRMMMNLKRCGILQNCKAILVGGMSDMNDNTVPYGKTAEEIILENTKDLDIPIIFGFPAGHISDNRAIIMGREAELQINQNQIKFKQYGHTQRSG